MNESCSRSTISVALKSGTNRGLTEQNGVAI